MSNTYRQIFSNNEPTSCVGFLVQDLKLAFPTQHVVSVQTNVTIVPIPKSKNRYIVGVSNVNGIPVPFLDINTFFGLSPNKNIFEPNKNDTLMCLAEGGTEVCFFIDTVVGAMSVSGKQLISATRLPQQVFHRLNFFLDHSFPYTDDTGVQNIFFLLSTQKVLAELTN